MHNPNSGHRRDTSPLITGNDEIDRQRFQILCVINNAGPTKIVRELGLAPQTVSGVIHRRYNLQRVIRHLEKLPHQLNTLNRIIKKSQEIVRSMSFILWNIQAARHFVPFNVIFFTAVRISDINFVCIFNAMKLLRC